MTTTPRELEERLAQRRLIDAAPDLLKAAKLAREDLQCYKATFTVPDDYVCDCVRCKLDAAIEKAETRKAPLPNSK